MTQLPYPPIGVALNKGGPPDRAWAVWVLNLYRLLRDADDTSIGELIDQITSGLYDLPTEPPRRRPLEQELLAAPARGEKPTKLVLDDAPARRPEDVRLLNELLDAVIPRKIRSKDLITALASPPPIGRVNPDKAYFDAVFYTTAGYTPANTIGETYWDTNDSTLAIVRSATHILQVGEEETRKCVNKTGVQIDNGQVVYVSGAQGNRPSISLAKADALSTAMLIGVATENIADNAEGAITIGGALRSYDTSGFTAGDQLYLSTATAGLLTKTPPTTGYLCPVAVALNATNNGMILVAPKCPLALTATLGAGAASNLVAPSQKAVYDAFLAPPAIGSVTPGSGAFTTLTWSTSAAGTATSTATSGVKELTSSTLTGNPGSASTSTYRAGAFSCSSSGAFAITTVTGVNASSTHAGSGVLNSAIGVNASTVVTGGNATNAYALYGTSSFTGTTTLTAATTAPLRGLVSLNNANLTCANLFGIDLAFTLTAGGTLTNFSGVNVAAITTTGFATVTTVSGYTAGAINAGGSSTRATNAYQIKTGNVTGATNNYQLNLGTGWSRFADTTDATASSASIFTLGGIYATKLIWGATGKFGGSTNYTLFEADGTRVANGAATTFDDVYPSGISLGVGAAAPSFSAYNGNMKAYEFVGATLTKEYHLAFQIPHTYKEGSSIVPHLHLYIPNDATGGVVKFSCEYTWVNINGPEPSTATLTGTVTVAAAAGNQGNVILSFGTLTGPWKTISSILSCRIFRDPTDASDTFGASVWVKSADVHIECDTDGSRTITAK